MNYRGVSFHLRVQFLVHDHGRIMSKDHLRLVVKYGLRGHRSMYGQVEVEVMNVVHRKERF